ncbi:recombination regulator RecX [Arthrobacter sp. PAMC25284]|uniref:Regulatory protein RecX n=1 Tax=Arthrobacter oryzae TaxID=409290 RepID=A0A3N0C4B0_9MICC|nr:recombination regulator RecX [Arthrobacter sp. PAMC25284]RNL57533.1 regulatory protein RecX [Arthrobacter oryzae]
MDGTPGDAADGPDDSAAGPGRRPRPSQQGPPGEDRDADPAAVARAIVLRQLTTSPKSRLQLSRKLAERNVPEDVAEAVLDRFEEVRLIDDAEFADMWVRSRSQTRKLARGALRRELADKGISPDTAAVALEQVSDEDEENAARELVRRKLRGFTGGEDRAERDKITRRLASMLARKGYQPSQAFRIVSEVLEAAVADTGD